MAIGFDKALGIHPDALMFRSKRTSVLANNLANADTPGFKARDIRFEDIIAKEKKGPVLDLASTDKRHFDLAEAKSSNALYYRNPIQPAVDGNSVDTAFEQAQFSENTLKFQASFTFLNGKFKGLMTAIKGQ